MGLKREEVFVIRKIDFKESDHIVRLFGRKSGKFSGIAKGARKLESKFGSTFNLLNRSEVVYYQGSSLNFISEGEVLDGWESLKKSGEAIDVGLRCAKSIGELLGEEQPSPQVYGLFRDTLEELDADQRRPRLLEVGFYLKALKYLGFDPDLEDRCLSCGVAIDQESTLQFSPVAGGFLCEKCRGGNDMELSRGDRKSLARLKKLPQSRLRRLRVPERKLTRYYDLLNRFSEYHLERELVPRSLRTVPSDRGPG
ncbi:MAG: DNA repair protein RecO [Candidatus Bipolaricaulota bacterium]